MRTDPLIIMREFMEREHEGETRRSGGPYSAHPLAISNAMTTPYGRIVMLPHDVPESAVKKAFNHEMPPSQQAEEFCIQQALARIALAFKQGGYGRHDEIVPFEANRSEPASISSPRFTVGNLIHDVDALTFRVYQPEGQTKAELYRRGIDRLIERAERTGVWELLEGKIRDIKSNDDHFACEAKRGMYRAQLPRLVIALERMQPQPQENDAVAQVPSPVKPMLAMPFMMGLVAGPTQG